MDTLVDELFCDNFFFPRRSHFLHGRGGNARHGHGGRQGDAFVAERGLNERRVALPGPKSPSHAALLNLFS